MHVSSTLRERNKARTRAALSEAAVAIIREQGVERLTAELVADRAGVSRRTFFNYFPSVDAAMACSVEALLAELTVALEARPTDESIWETIPAILTAPEGSAIVERIALLATTRDHSAQARHMAHDHVEAFVDWLAQWVTNRVGTDDTLYAATLAASVAAAAEAAVRVWISRPGFTGLTTESLADYRALLNRSLDLLREGFERPRPA
jgi:AcrR family transcriptional regulator